MFKRIVLGVGSIMLLCLSGCLNLDPKADPTRFYTLSGMTEAEGWRLTSGPVVGVKRVVLPEYLDRPHIVTEVGGGELKLAEFHRWAEPVDMGVTRVIVQNLSGMLEGYGVVGEPWSKTGRPDYELHITILDFKPQICQGHIYFQAHYHIDDVKKKEEVHSGDVSMTVGLCKNCCVDYLSIVRGMSRVLEKFSEEMAGGFNGARSN